jgi:hypothetical protein
MPAQLRGEQQQRRPELLASAWRARAPPTLFRIGIGRLEQAFQAVLDQFELAANGPLQREDGDRRSWAS